jgi:hypothetical protein
VSLVKLARREADEPENQAEGWLRRRFDEESPLAPVWPRSLGATSDRHHADVLFDSRRDLEASQAMATPKALTPTGTVQQRILLIRGERVIVDADLAHFYGVPTKRLNEQVRRNRARFPVDFMFRLTAAERAEVVAKCDHLASLRFSKALPQAFTEHGTIMAANVLNSPRAVEMSVFIVRAFVAIRRTIAANTEIAQKVAQLEQRLTDHDEQILLLVRAIKELAAPPPASTGRKIGFEA